MGFFPFTLSLWKAEKSLYIAAKIIESGKDEKHIV